MTGLPSRRWIPYHSRRPASLIAQGLSNQEIADRIAVSEPTVRTHVSRILGRLHVASRTQATLYAVRKGLTDPDEASADWG